MNPRNRNRPLAVWILVTLPTFLVGCDGASENGVVASWTGDILSILGLEETPDQLERGANDLFELAEPLAIDEEIRLAGMIDPPQDVDLFDIGPRAAGTRLRVAVEGSDGLDPAAAVLDADHAVLSLNDDRGAGINWRDAYIDVVLPWDLPQCFVAVAASPQVQAVGSYTLTIQVSADEPVPAVREQVVVLNFRGAGSVRIGSRLPMTVPAFDARLIDPALDGLTDEIVEHVAASVRRDFAPYGVTVVSTSEGADPNGAGSTVYFGNYNPDLLGLADAVDRLNQDARDKAIVFVETFSLFMPLEPDAEEMAGALANVASHEIGHLLGLVHTSDPNGLMDITASAGRLLEDQQFTISPLHESVFPIGWQDGTMLLERAVGIRPGVDRNTLMAAKFGRIAKPARILGPFLGKMCGTCNKAHKH